MIYDCFLYNSEEDILDLRLNILGDTVDKFILLEGTQTFRGNDKPLSQYFNRYDERWSNWYNKIENYVHITYGDDTWQRESNMRNALKDLLDDIHGPDPDDLILLSDCDEIPNPELLRDWNYDRPMKFVQDMYYYYLNVYAGKWRGTVGGLYKDLYTPQSMRHDDGQIQNIDNGGWHFSYFGGEQKIKEKIQSFSHTEVDQPQFTDLNEIKRRMENNTDPFDRGTLRVVELDDSFPKYVLDNKDKLARFIK